MQLVVQRGGALSSSSETRLDGEGDELSSDDWLRGRRRFRRSDQGLRRCALPLSALREWVRTTAAGKERHRSVYNLSLWVTAGGSTRVIIISGATGRLLEPGEVLFPVRVCVDLVRPVVRRPLGLVLEQPHRLDGIGRVEREAVVDLGRAKRLTLVSAAQGRIRCECTKQSDVLPAAAQAGRQPRARPGSNGRPHLEAS